MSSPLQGLTAVPCVGSRLSSRADLRPSLELEAGRRLELADGLRPAVELGQAAPIPGREAVLELVEVVVEVGGAEIVELGRSRGGLERMPRAAVARGDQRRLDGGSLVAALV